MDASWTRRGRAGDAERQRLEPRTRAALRIGRRGSLPQRLAQPKDRRQLRPARRAAGRRVDGFPSRSHGGDAIGVCSGRGRSVARHDAPKGVAVEERAGFPPPPAPQAVKGENLRGEARRMLREGSQGAAGRKKRSSAGADAASAASTADG